MNKNNKSPSTLFKLYNEHGFSLKNRFVMAPMSRCMCPNNTPDQNVLEYYLRRAQGGVGLIITEGAYINPTSGGATFSDPTQIPILYEDTAFNAWRPIVQAVHTANSRIFIQLWHVGSARDTRQPPIPGLPSYGPSAIMNPNQFEGQSLPQALDNATIEIFINDFITAAVKAKSLGFDGVEIHAGHGYLIDQFFWDYSNRRQDQYGGNCIKQRTRFACEIVKGIRRQVGNNFPISLRFSQWKIADYKAKLCHNPQELASFLIPLCEAGVDIFHCSNRYFNTPEFSNSPLTLAGWVKKLTGKTTISVGAIGLHSDFLSAEQQLSHQQMIDKLKNDLNELERLFSAKQFDLIAIGRSLIADPFWVDKVSKQRYEDIIFYRSNMLDTLS